jgi:hypothetical protein
MFHIFMTYAFIICFSSRGCLRYVEVKSITLFNPNTNNHRVFTCLDACTCKVHHTHVFMKEIVLFSLFHKHKQTRPN